MKDNAKTGYHSMKSAGSKVRQIHPAWNIINVHRGERAFTVSLKKLTESHLSTYNPKHSVSKGRCGPGQNIKRVRRARVRGRLTCAEEEAGCEGERRRC